MPAQEVPRIDLWVRRAFASLAPVLLDDRGLALSTNIVGCSVPARFLNAAPRNSDARDDTGPCGRNFIHIAFLKYTMWQGGVKWGYAYRIPRSTCLNATLRCDPFLDYIRPPPYSMFGQPDLRREGAGLHHLVDMLAGPRQPVAIL